jgi:Ca2+-binding RTX toxin-like protein
MFGGSSVFGGTSIAESTDTSMDGDTATFGSEATGDTYSYFDATFETEITTSTTEYETSTDSSAADAAAATAAAAAATSADADQTWTGTNLTNILTGGSGNDTIDGLAGDDTLTGNDGNDTLTGGSGSDTLSGGAGADIYNYTAVTDGSTTAGGGDILKSSDWEQGIDVAHFSQTAFGNLALGSVSFLSAGAFDTNASTTLSNLTATAGADSDGYYVDLNGVTLTSTIYDDIDAAIASGSGATGAGFVAVHDGNNVAILYDAAFETSNNGLVEMAQVTGLSDGGSGTSLITNTDLMIV